MAQIAAEELGLPLEHVDVVLGDSARGPYASISAGSSTLPSMGPAVRAAAADAREQVEDIAEQRGMPKGTPAARRSSRCSRSRRSSARARAARTRPG